MLSSVGTGSDPVCCLAPCSAGEARGGGRSLGPALQRLLRPSTAEQELRRRSLQAADTGGHPYTPKQRLPGLLGVGRAGTATPPHPTAESRGLPPSPRHCSCWAAASQPTVEGAGVGQLDLGKTQEPLSRSMDAWAHTATQVKPSG